MKFKLYVFLILLFGDSAFAQVKFANVIGPQTYKYGTIGNVVYKFDSTGQSVWSKSLAGTVISNSDTNVVLGSAFDGYYLFVLLMQGYNNTGIQNVYGSVVMMDTLGNISFVKTTAVQAGGSYSFYNIYPSLRHGAWVMDTYAPGFTRIVQTQHVDTNGTFGTLIDYWYGSVSSPVKMIVMPDSSYIVCVNYSSTASTIVGFPTLTKLDRNGQVVWRKDYSTNLSTVNWEAWNAYDIAADSSGNIYMFCGYWGGNKNGDLTIKFDKQGQPVLAKYWPTYVTSTNYPKITYSNGQIIAKLNSSEIVYDTLWNNACLGSQPAAISIHNNYFSQPHSHTYSAQTFSPANASVFQYTPIVLPDYCTVNVSVENMNLKNPTIKIEFKNGMISIEAETDYNELHITDLSGRAAIQKSINHRFEFDTGLLLSGIYFITVRNQFETATKKILVE